MNKQNNFQYLAIEKALKLGDSSNHKILEIGFGNGYLLNRFLKKYDCTFYGIDISDTMLSQCQKRNSQAINNKRLHVVTALAENLPFSNHSFDKIYTVNTSYFWQSLDAGFSEIKRCLKKDGTFYLAFYSKAFLDSLPATKKGYAKYHLEEYRKIGLLHGFVIYEIEVIPNKAYVFKYVKCSKS